MPAGKKRRIRLKMTPLPTGERRFGRAARAAFSTVSAPALGLSPDATRASIRLAKAAPTSRHSTNFASGGSAPEAGIVHGPVDASFRGHQSRDNCFDGFVAGQIERENRE